MCSISLTEPGGGTDVLGAMKTPRAKVDGGWVINGTKIWSTLAHVADRLFLVARTNSDVKRSVGRADGLPLRREGRRE